MDNNHCEIIEKERMDNFKINHNSDKGKYEVNKKQDYIKLIEECIIKEKIKVKYALFTTYSFEFSYFENIFNHKLFRLLKSEKIDVLYNYSGLRVKDIGDIKSVINEDRLHSIVNNNNNNNNKSFHPKISLFKCSIDSDNSDKNKYEYYLIVSSKNLTSSNYLDAYVLLQGSQEDVRGKHCNGKKLSDFLKRYINENEVELVDDNVIEEISKVNFLPVENDDLKANILSIDFLTAEDISGCLNYMEEFAVVSPFLDKNIDKDKISMIISTSEGFKGIDSSLINKIDKDIMKVLDLHVENDSKQPKGLHSKIFCGINKINKHTVIIIGSSNATGNGGLSGNVENVNAEFNVKLEFSDSDGEIYKDFISGFADLEDLNTDDLSDTEDNKDTEKILDTIFKYVYRGFAIETIYKEDENKYIIEYKINKTNDYSIEEIQGKEIKIQDKEIKIQDKDETYELKIDVSHTLIVGIEISLNNKGKCYYINMFDKLKKYRSENIRKDDKNIMENIDSIILGRDKAISENINSLSEKLTNDYFAGKVTLSNRKNNDTKGNSSEKNIYQRENQLFESMMRFSLGKDVKRLKEDIIEARTLYGDSKKFEEMYKGLLEAKGNE